MSAKPRTCPQCGRKYAETVTQCAVDGCALYGPEDEQRIGKVVGNHKLMEIIGVGGMGVVYRGMHTILEKPVAVKILSQRFALREGGVDQFLREAKAATRTRHPNIVDVTDFGTSDSGETYFVMEYLEGISLEDVLARDGTVPLFNAVNIVRQIARALAAAHEEGIVHRDLKPENVFLVSREGRRRVVRRVSGGSFVVENEGRFDFVKLFDFGVAKYTMEDVGPSYTTRAGMIFGTPQYMSPEQARGDEVDGRSDIYALGILFYEMLTGDVPFDADAALDILNAHVAEIPQPPSQKNPGVVVDEATDRTIMKCLEKRPEDRYQTADELADALSDCFTDQVFLRDAHLMPGAVEAGILPPHAPTPMSQSSSVAPVATATGASVATGASSRASDGAAAEAPRKQGRSITDDLSELFGGREAQPVPLEPALQPAPLPREALNPEALPPEALQPEPSLDADEQDARRQSISEEKTRVHRVQPGRNRRITDKGLGEVQRTNPPAPASGAPSERED